MGRDSALYVPQPALPLDALQTANYILGQNATGDAV